VDFEDGVAHVTKVLSYTGDVNFLMVGRKKRVGYSFEIVAKVRMEVFTGEGVKILVNDLEGTMRVWSKSLLWRTQGF
jgi:hypothetical protein